MRVVFIGTGDIGLPVLRWLEETPEHQLVGVATQPDKPVGREQRIQPPPVKAALADSTIPVLQPQRIKRDEALAAIRELAPEVIVVMAYGQILPRALLEIPTIACVNLHASLLPKHRGAAPIQAAIVAGDRETGITVMYMDEGLDTGDMLLQSRITIASDETGGSLHDRLAEVAPSALQNGLHLLAAGTAPRIPQNSADATYAPKLEREHGLIDWSQTADSIERKIRAFDPWPGAYTLVREPAGSARKLKIFRARLLPRSSGASERRLVARDGEFIAVAASNDLVLENVQLDGKRRMNSAELLRGNAWLDGAAIV